MAESLGRAGDRTAAKRAIELDRRIVVGKRPHDQAAQPALSQIATRRGEQAPAEPEPLKFRAQVKFVDFAVVGEAASAVAAVIRVTGDAVAEHEQRHAAAFANGALPPHRTAPADQLREFGPGDDALIRSPPCLVVGRCHRLGIGRLGSADFYQGRRHARIEASSLLPFKSRINARLTLSRSVAQLHHFWAAFNAAHHRASSPQS